MATLILEFLRRGTDPLDAKNRCHAGEWEFASATDAAVLRDILKVKDGAGGDYWWVERGACDMAWQGSVLRRERRVTTNPLLRRGAGCGCGGTDYSDD